MLYLLKKSEKMIMLLNYKKLNREINRAVVIVEQTYCNRCKKAGITPDNEEAKTRCFRILKDTLKPKIIEKKKKYILLQIEYYVWYNKHAIRND